jgi:hypothetical protein
MWSSDYPHTAIWPKIAKFIKETFSGLAEVDRRRLSTPLHACTESRIESASSAICYRVGKD